MRPQNHFFLSLVSFSVLFPNKLLALCQVNAIAFHPVHGTLATVGSDGRFSFWDKDARTKLKTSEQLDQPITACCFNNNGNIFAYASSYDWSKVRGLKWRFGFRLLFFFLPHHCERCVPLRATSTTTPRRKTTSFWGTPLRSWSLGTRNGERRAATLCYRGDRGHRIGLPHFLSDSWGGGFQGNVRVWAVSILIWFTVNFSVVTLSLQLLKCGFADSGWKVI